MATFNLNVVFSLFHTTCQARLSCACGKALPVGVLQGWPLWVEVREERCVKICLLLITIQIYLNWEKKEKSNFLRFC